MNEKNTQSLLDLINKLITLVGKNVDNINDLAKESGLNINDAEIIRTNSTGLIMYNPKNAAEMLKSMKNKNQTREEKILARVKYDQEQARQ